MILLSAASMPVMAQSDNSKFVIESSCNIEGGGSVSIEGTVNDIPSGESEVSLVLSGKRLSCNVSPNRKGNADFEFENVAEIKQNEVIKFTLEHIAGEDTVRYNSSFTAFNKKVLVEEGTGLWCGACVAGIVAMKDMKEKYPGKTAGVALHYGTYANTDPMAADNIMEYINTLFASYPTVIMDRNPELKQHPNSWKVSYLKAIAVNPLAGITLEAVKSEDASSVYVTSRLIFANDYDDADFRMAYYVIENNVHSEDDSYAQRNYYANNAMGKMGGFENLPDPVPASEMYYQEVGRSSIGGINGIEGSLPAVIRAGEEVVYSHSIVLPENIMNKDEVEIVAYVLDGKTGLVANAEILSVKETAVGGIHETEDMANVNVWTEDGVLRISSSDIIDHIYVYSIDGTMVKSLSSAENEVMIDSESMHGAYIVKVIQGRNVATRKVVI